MHGSTDGPGLSFWVLNHINVTSMRETGGEEYEMGDGEVEFENHSSILYTFLYSKKSPPHCPLLPTNKGSHGKMGDKKGWKEKWERVL